MARPDRCTCGRMPHTRARRRTDGTFVTLVACPGLGCEAIGPSVEDDHRDDDGAIALWNQHGGRKAA